MFWKLCSHQKTEKSSQIKEGVVVFILKQVDDPEKKEAFMHSKAQHGKVQIPYMLPISREEKIQKKSQRERN